MNSNIDFRLRLAAEVHAGEVVPIALAVTNTGDATIELYLRGRTIAFDVIVQSEAGAVVWQRLSGEIIPAILQLKALPAGESLILTTRWDQRTQSGVPVPAGTYSVRGLLLTDGEPMQTPVVTLHIRASPVFH